MVAPTPDWAFLEGPQGPRGPSCVQRARPGTVVETAGLDSRRSDVGYSTARFPHSAGRIPRTRPRLSRTLVFIGGALLFSATGLRPKLGGGRWRNEAPATPGFWTRDSASVSRLADFKVLFGDIRHPNSPLSLVEQTRKCVRPLSGSRRDTTVYVFQRQSNDFCGDAAGKVPDVSHPRTTGQERQGTPRRTTAVVMRIAAPDNRLLANVRFGHVLFVCGPSCRAQPIATVSGDLRRRGPRASFLPTPEAVMHGDEHGAGRHA